MNKLITILLLTSIIACGGGGSSSDDEPIIQPPPVQSALPNLFSFVLQPKNSTRQFTGMGALSNQVIYTRPTTIAASDSVVTGELVIMDRGANNNLSINIKLFDYISRSLKLDESINLSFDDMNWSGSNVSYDMTLKAEQITGSATLDLIAGQWSQASAVGMFNDDFLTLVNHSGSITGDDTSGCSVTGNINPSGKVYDIDLTLTGCASEGLFIGSMWLNDDKLTGAITSNDHGIALNYRVAR